MKIILRWTLAALLLSFGSIGWGQAPNIYNKFSPVTGVLKGSATSYFTSAAVSADIRGLWSGTCDATTFLRGDGACIVPAGTGITFSMPSGFTVSGSPGATISVSTALNGVLKGTGSAFSTATAADIYGLWSGTCSSTTFLRGDGACASVSAAPGGSNTQVQFNNSSAFGGSANFAWDNTNNFLKLSGAGGGVLQSSTAKPLNLIGGDEIADITSSAITLGSNGSSGSGGAVTITAGPAATSGNGGAVSLNAGNGTGSLQSGGSISLSAGSPGAGGAGGVIAMYTSGGTLRQTINADGGITVGSPTGGDKGAGSVNMQSCFVNGTACSTTAGTVTSITAGTGLTGGTISSSGTIALSTPVAVANGGTGTAAPSLVAGTNVTITGSWPNQTINSSGGSGGIIAAAYLLGTGASCSVSGGSNVSSCARISTGQYRVTLTSGTFAASTFGGVCVSNIVPPSGATSAPYTYSQPTSSSTNTFDVFTMSGSTINFSDLNISVRIVCWSY